MKQITCTVMVGEPSCDLVLTGATAQELIEKGWGHLKEAHPDLAKKIEAHPKEENDKWMADFAAKFDTLADA